MVWCHIALIEGWLSKSGTTETVRDAAQCASRVAFGRRIRELSEHADCVFQAMIETILAVRQSV